ncbi:HAD hydrolase family protein [Mycolicibacterium sp. CBM1]
MARDDVATFPKGHPAMVALDVDGTVHTAAETNAQAHKSITPAVRAAVSAVVRSGAHVVLCTGRLSPATMPFLRELGIAAGFAVCSNGAVLIDAATGGVVEPDEAVADLTAKG